MRLQPQDPESIEHPETRAVFEEIDAAFGLVPNLFRTYAHHPALLRANWEKTKVLMAGDGALRQPLKEAIALAVSHDNGCDYCVAAHSQALRALGLDDARIEAIENDVDGDGFSDAERALLRFARNANRDPRSVSDPDFAELAQAGWEPRQWVEALGVVELFRGFNTFLDTLDVAIDF